MSMVHEVERPSGIRVAYGSWGEADARPMVFAHALTGVGTAAGPFLGPLVQDGWTVAAPDQRGHGRSTPVTEPELLDVRHCAGDLLAVMDDLGWDRAWLAGGSMGCAPAMAAAVGAPDRVEGLLLLAPGFGRERNAGHEDFARIADAFDAGGFEAGAAAWSERMRARGSGDALIEQQVHQLAQHDVASLACFLRTVTAWTLPETLDQLTGLDVPVVVVSWDGDEIHPRALAEEIATSAPQGELVPIDHAAMSRGEVTLLDTAMAALRRHAPIAVSPRSEP